MDKTSKESASLQNIIKEIDEQDERIRFLIAENLEHFTEIYRMKNILSNISSIITNISENICRLRQLCNAVKPSTVKTVEKKSAMQSKSIKDIEKNIEEGVELIRQLTAEDLEYDAGINSIKNNILNINNVIETISEYLHRLRQLCNKFKSTSSEYTPTGQDTSDPNKPGESKPICNDSDRPKAAETEEISITSI